MLSSCYRAVGPSRAASTSPLLVTTAQTHDLAQQITTAFSCQVGGGLGIESHRGDRVLYQGEPPCQRKRDKGQMSGSKPKL